MLPKKEVRKQEPKIILAVIESIRDIETDEPINTYVNGNELVSIHRDDMVKGKPLVLKRNYGDYAESRTPIESVMKIGNNITIYTETEIFNLRVKFG